MPQLTGGYMRSEYVFTRIVVLIQGQGLDGLCKGYFVYKTGMNAIRGNLRALTTAKREKWKGEADR